MEILLLFLLPIGVMLLMTRSAKNRQRQALEMRGSLEPGTGVRTIGGMYAQVKEVREDTVLLELTPGVQALFAKNAIGAVLEAEEYEQIISGEPVYEEGEPVVPDDASSLTGDDAGEPDGVKLGKQGSRDAEGAVGSGGGTGAEDEAETQRDSRNSTAEGDNGSTS